jgi:hypothetical protein
VLWWLNIATMLGWLLSVDPDGAPRTARSGTVTISPSAAVCYIIPARDPTCRWLYPSGRAGLVAHSWLFCCGGCATRWMDAGARHATGSLCHVLR